MSTRTGRVLRGLLMGYGNQALLTLVGLWLTAFLIGRLGNQDYGLWLVATRLLSYLMLLDVGVIALLPREVAFATGRAGGDAARAHDLPAVLGRTWRIVQWQAPLVGLVAVAVWLALPDQWAELGVPLAVVFGAFVLTFPLRVFQALLTGLQELAYLGVVHSISWISGTAVTVTLVLAGYGLYALAVGWAVTQALAAVLWWRRLRDTRPELARFEPRVTERTELTDRLKRSGWVSVQQVAQVLLSGTDLLLIGLLLDPAAVVVYFCTAKVLTVLAHQPQILAEAAQPALSELRTGADRQHLIDVSTALTRAILLASGAVVCVVLVVNEGFVTWWVGADQYGGATLTVVLLAGMLLRHWNVTAVYSLFAFGQDRRLSLTSLADGLVTVALSALLIGQLGILGAALGIVIGVVTVGLPLNVSGLAREIGVSGTALVAGVLPWGWRFALLAVLAGVVGQLWSPDTLPGLVVATVVTGGAYALAMLPFALREPLGRYVRPRLDRIRRLVLRDAALSNVDA